MTPETKTPTRAEALADLERLHYQDSQGEWVRASHDDFEGFIAAHYQTIKAALATDAPIFEASEPHGWMIECKETSGSTYYRSTFAMAEHFVKHSKEGQGATITPLYAQGRTRGAGLKIDRDVFEEAAAIFNRVDGKLSLEQHHTLFEVHNFIINNFDNLSAAPPVTEGAWLPIDEGALRERLNGLLKQLQKATDVRTIGQKNAQIALAKLEVKMIRECFTPQPLPTPPSSQTRGG